MSRKPLMLQGVEHSDPEKKRKRIARYKAKRARLDLMLPPAELERFRALPGLEALPYPERLAALMDCWERHGNVSSPAPSPGDALSLAQIAAELDQFDAELAAEDAAELGPAGTLPLPFGDASLPKVPPMPEQGHYQRLNGAIWELYQREWPKRKHGNSEEAKRWKWAIRQEPALFKAFQTLTYGRAELAKLIRHCCLGIGPNDILAWAELEDGDRQALLWYLAHAGAIYPEALGQIGERFRQALARQPKRHFLTWERES